jgi:regulator of protease activity HflC (stomatin/prohibitin superfamily)
MTNVDSKIIAANSRSTGALVLAGVAVILIVTLLSASVADVPAGSVGILTLFGRVTGEVLPAGKHFVSPFKINHKLSIQTQTLEEHTSTPSKEGLTLEMDISLLYHLNPEKAANVYQNLGIQYAPLIISPNLRAVIRDTTSGYSANTLYSSSRKPVEDKITEDLRNVLEPRGIIIEKVVLRDIRPPHTRAEPKF